MIFFASFSSTYIFTSPQTVPVLVRGGGAAAGIAAWGLIAQWGPFTIFGAHVAGWRCGRGIPSPPPPRPIGTTDRRPRQAPPQCHAVKGPLVFCQDVAGTRPPHSTAGGGGHFRHRWDTWPRWTVFPAAPQDGVFCGGAPDGAPQRPVLGPPRCACVRTYFHAILA